MAETLTISETVLVFIQERISNVTTKTDSWIAIGVITDAIKALNLTSNITTDIVILASTLRQYKVYVYRYCYNIADKIARKA